MIEFGKKGKNPMNEIFPSMYSKPEKIQIFALIPCWIFIFLLFPMYLPYIGFGLWDQAESGSWIEIGYHVVNCGVLLFVMREYLKEEWFMVTTDFRYYIKYVALTVGLIVGMESLLFGALYLYGYELSYMSEFLPITEMFVSQTPLLLISTQPIFGTITLSVFSPISICILFYCFCFAPVCNNKPLFAYLSVAAVSLIPPILNIIWRGDAEVFLYAYLIQLPIHLFACWSYQKTDNVWTPIVSLGILNLLTSVILMFW